MNGTHHVLQSRFQQKPFCDRASISFIEIVYALMGCLRTMMFYALVFGLLHQTGAQSDVQNVTAQLTDLDLWCIVPCWQKWCDELSSFVPFKVKIISLTFKINACLF